MFIIFIFHNFDFFGILTWNPLSNIYKILHWYKYAAIFTCLWQGSAGTPTHRGHGKREDKLF